MHKMIAPILAGILVATGAHAIVVRHDKEDGAY